MTFFYDLNKKLASLGTQSGSKQLNERANSPVEEGLGDVVKKVGGAAKKLGAKALDKIGHGSDADMIRDLQKKMGLPQTGKKPEKIDELSPATIQSAAAKRDAQTPDQMSKATQRKDVVTHLSNRTKMNARPDQTKEGVDKEAFAKLAPPEDKITFADKIAGAKKEVDEMLGDVAAEAMKAALGGDPTRKKGTVTKTSTGIKHKAAPGVYGGSDDEEDPLDKLKGPSKSRMRKSRPEVDESDDDDNNPFTNWKKPRSTTHKPGDVEHGHKHDIKHTSTGRIVTRRTDANTGYSVGAEDDKPADGEKRGRGRPKGPAKAPERVTAKATKHKGGRKTTEDYGPMEEDSGDLKAAMALLKKAGYKVSKGEQELDEKAVSKKQQKFMGMVHATQKGEKAPSKEVAKVAKTMKKKDAEDFAATKHKGLPEKKAKKKEKTEEQGGTGTPTASSGFSYGKGIYDSMNRDLEDMIAESMSRLNESMSVNMSSSTEGDGSLTVTATDDDALKLATLLKSAGLGGGDSEGYGGSGYQSACGCGTPDCSCGDEEMDEAAPAVSDNEPNWPTNTETSDDALQYAGGLNKPKSTGQTTTPVIASQDERQESYAEAEEDAIKRMMEMAGISEAKGKKPDFLDVDKDGDKEEPFKKAVDDKKEKKVDESILASTANLWTEYKGKYGV